MSSDPSSQKLIILVDCSWLLRRWFETSAPKLGRTKDGHHVEVAALNGYLQTIANRFYGERREVEFDQMIHVLDSDGSDYRRGLFPEYKAGRSPKEPALTAQEAMLPRVLTALGEHIAQRRGVEADDLIATLARQFADQGHQVAIYTGDKDLFQLVEDGRILVIREKKNERGVNELDFFQEAEVLEKMKVNADQIAAYLALMGDTVDNIKGVHKVGKKTAPTLLSEYGSLEGILTNADNIKGKLGEYIRAARDSGSLELDYKLTRVLDKVPGISHEQYANPVIVETTLATQWHLTLGMIGHPLRLADHRVAHEQTVPRSEPPKDAPAPTPTTPGRPAPTARFSTSRAPAPAAPVEPRDEEVGSRRASRTAAAPASSLDSLVEDNPFEDAFATAPSAPTLSAAEVAALDLPFDLDVEQTDPHAYINEKVERHTQQEQQAQDARLQAEAAARETTQPSEVSVEPAVEAVVAPVEVRPVPPAPAVVHYAEEPAVADDFFGGFDDGFDLTERPEFAKGAPLKTLVVEDEVTPDGEASAPEAPAPVKRTRTAAGVEPDAPEGTLVTDVFPPAGLAARTVTEEVTVTTTVTHTTTAASAEPSRPARRFTR